MNASWFGNFTFGRHCFKITKPNPVITWSWLSFLLALFFVLAWIAFTLLMLIICRGQGSGHAIKAPKEPSQPELEDSVYSVHRREGGVEDAWSLKQQRRNKVAPEPLSQAASFRSQFTAHKHQDLDKELQLFIPTGRWKWRYLKG